MSQDEYYDAFVKDKMNRDFIPHRFEKIAKEYLIRLNKANKIKPPFLAIGAYAYNNPKEHKNGQFGIVTRDSIGNTFFECKFTKEKLGEEVALEERGQLQELNIPYYRLGFFSASGFALSKNQRDLYFTLDDMYSEDLMD